MATEPGGFRPPRLGPGAVYVRALEDVFRTHADLIRVAEFEPQTLWRRPTAPGAKARGNPRELRHLASLPQHKLTHGVGYPVGGLYCDQTAHVEEFRRWHEGLDAAWTSEHLSILEVDVPEGRTSLGFLMPPAQTDAQARLAVANIRARRATLGAPFGFETGVNYFAPRRDEMADGDFLALIAEEADCGILLDLTNLWINARNGRARVEDVLARLPLDRVWEMHLGGPLFAHGYWLDAHAGALDPDIVRMALEIAPDLPNLGAILYEISSDRLSAFGTEAFLAQMESLSRVWDRVPPPRAAAPAAMRRPATHSQWTSPANWERTLIAGLSPISQGASGAEARAFELYRSLAGSFRRGAVAELLPTSLRLLQLALGEADMRAVVGAYTDAAAPMFFPTDEALAFRRFLDERNLSVPGLADILAFEAALIEAAANGGAVKVSLSQDINALCRDIAAGRLPEAGNAPTTLEITMTPEPAIRELQA